jgi:hypothetical protein
MNRQVSGKAGRKSASGLLSSMRAGAVGHGDGWLFPHWQRQRHFLVEFQQRPPANPQTSCPFDRTFPRLHRRRSSLFLLESAVVAGQHIKGQLACALVLGY